MKELKKFLLENLSPKQIVLKNTLWLYLSEFSSKGIRAIVFFLVGRALGPYNFGIFEYFISFVGMIFLFADFGVSAIFIRDYQQKENKIEYIKNAFTLKILLPLIFGLLSLIAYFFSKKLVPFDVYFLIASFITLQNIESFFEAYFIAIQKAERRFIFNIISSISLVILILVGFSLSKSILTVSLAYLFSIIIGLIVGYFLFTNEIKVKISLDFSLVKYYLSNGFPLALFGLLGYIFFSTDKLILSYLKPIESVGFYSAAARLVNSLFLFSYLFNTALFPQWAKMVISYDKKRLKHFFKLILVSLIGLAFLISIIATLSAPFLIPLIFGNKFLNSISLFQVMVWIIIFVFPTGFLDLFLISYNRQWLDFFITLIPAILNIILNFILIPIYGTFGAIYSSLMAQCLNFLLTFFISLNILKKETFIIKK